MGKVKLLSRWIADSNLPRKSIYDGTNLSYSTITLLAFISAIEHNQENSVKTLLKDNRSDPDAHNNAALRTAIQLGNASIVQLLLKYVDPSVNDDYIMRLVCFYGDIHIVKVLLADERVNPSANNNSTLEVAVSQGHEAIVKLLLKHKKTNRTLLNGAIQIANEHKRHSILNLLLQSQLVN